MSIHEKNSSYKNKILTAPYEICIERARYYTESYRKTEGEHPAIRAAKALKHTLRNMSVYILDEESIVGNRSSKLVASVIPVERGDINTVLEMELDFLLNREKQPYHIDPEDKRELLEDILLYWKGKTIRDKKKQLWKQNGLYVRPSFSPVSLYKRYRGLDIDKIRHDTTLPKFSLSYLKRAFEEILYNNPAFLTNIFDVQGHLVIGHKNVLKTGLKGIKKKAERKLSMLGSEDENEDKKAFLEAVIISIDAAREYALRLFSLAQRMAITESEPGRKKELREISAICKKVSDNKPETFKEAVQCFWFTQVVAIISYGMPGILATGRLDQFLYPFYKRDLKAGLITEAEATKLMEELILKLSYNLLLLPYLGKNTGNELGADSCSPTIGGTDIYGNDAVNELSNVILQAYRNVKSMGNSFSIRLSEKNPEQFWKNTMATYRDTSGAALFYDKAVVGSMVKSGMTRTDANDYAIIGCVEQSGDGNTFACTSGNDLSMVSALEMALLNGHLRIMGKRIGPQTGKAKEFKSFDDLFDAFKKQLSFLVKLVVKATNLKDQVYQEYFPNPFISATIEGCIETGLDMTSGGAKYNFNSLSARGFATTVDSLLAVKQMVFDTQTISLEELVRILDKNFRDETVLQTRLKNRCIKYGTDTKEADELAAEIAEYFCKEVSKEKTLRGGPYRPGFFSYGMHVMDGLFLGATADGRNAGEPVSNSFSPVNGVEKLGPTAVMKSVSKIKHENISNGYALNMKFMPSLFDNDEKLGKMISLVRSYFAQGGMELSPNVISSEILKDAQINPQNYLDLVVRVSGYSALFCDLGTQLQNEIISRTEFGKL